jgi:hypothetical protein
MANTERDSSKVIMMYPIYPNSTMSSTESNDYGKGECLSSSNCFLPFGICVNSTTCMCLPDYANFNKTGIHNPTMFCFYKKKKVIIAGLLELFFPFALGHFYSGNLKLAFIKLVYNISVYIFMYVLFAYGLSNEDLCGSSKKCLVLCCVIPVWNTIDLLLFFNGIYKDGNGISLG